MVAVEAAKKGGHMVKLRIELQSLFESFQPMDLNRKVHQKLSNNTTHKQTNWQPTNQIKKKEIHMEICDCECKSSNAV